ncbi:MAG: hypothetical protein IKZ61_03660 [Prevotella sp.]|nr:hypothetical protein [Prevotella sp.]
MKNSLTPFPSPAERGFFSVFAFSDFTAWNAAVGVDGEWRKLVCRQATSMSNDNLKDEISKRVIFVFVNGNTEFYGSPLITTNYTQIKYYRYILVNSWRCF